MSLSVLIEVVLCFKFFVTDVTSVIFLPMNLHIFPRNQHITNLANVSHLVAPKTLTF